ncbi:helix-turn-helix domain-containing protein [Roseibium album]|uniref:Transcriptional regulator EutR n=1 Tax=Roseibium album TaxID=311410 RepID=A0A0M7AX12_9HYPH|nr:helix-turn-helix domain-containing protein [Roseibium album]CTQ62000.1 transcriptional regulator EutR [Roseibium album]CTQ78323.1 transcriptional regulator EutR [Roseibium album]CTQ79765.1 transcriptional regulator EutR [Roseibium album]
MEEQPLVKRLSCEDVEDYSDLFDGWTHTVTQMEAGRFGYSGLSINLPDLKVFIDTHTRPLRWCEYPHIPVTAIYIPLHSAGDVRWRGREMSNASVVVQGTGEEQHFIVGANTQAIYVDIGQQLIQSLGWHDLKNGQMTVASEPRKRFVRYCFDLTAQQPDRDASPQLFFKRNNLLRLLREMLFPAIASGHSNSGNQVRVSDFEVLILCEELLMKTGMTKPVTNSDLAGQIGISERRFYRAFENQLGMSPTRYIELLRLHALRRALLSEERTNHKIADTMTEFGFTNAGRTARRYSELFYEYPKATTALRFKRTTTQDCS